MYFVNGCSLKVRSTNLFTECFVCIIYKYIVLDIDTDSEIEVLIQSQETYINK